MKAGRLELAARLARKTFHRCDKSRFDHGSIYNSPVNDPDLERAAVFRAGLRRFLKQTETATTKAGLTPRRYDLLLFVQASPGHRLTTTELTTQLQLGQPAVTELVKRAVAAGLLRRTRDDLDRRRIWIELTPAGRDALLTAFHALRSARAELAASIVQVEAGFRLSS